MKKMFIILPALAVLLGISDVAFAKHHNHFKKEDNQDNPGRKVPCLVRGVQQMVKSEEVCKDFNGTVVTDKIPPEAKAVSKEKSTEQKTQNP
jgi:hypothetical protein